MSTDTEYSSLIVFYDGIKSTVEDLPGEWKCIETALIPPIETLSKYTYFAYYKGPTQTKTEAEKDLNEKMHVMANAGVYKSYHIQNTFLPVPV